MNKLTLVSLSFAYLPVKWFVYGCAIVETFSDRLKSAESFLPIEKNSKSLDTYVLSGINTDGIQVYTYWKLSANSRGEDRVLCK